MSTDPYQPESPLTPTADADVWQRLQEQLHQLQATDEGATDQQDLERRLAQRAKSLRQTMERPGSDETRITFLAFNKQEERYGISLDEVAAVESLEHFTPVPNAPHFIRGVTPWRGSILSLVDLGRLFGRSESGIADLRSCVIVETAGRRLAIVAFEMEEIFSVPQSELATPPDLPGPIAPEWIIGVHDENRLILRMSEVLKGIASAS